MNHCINCAWSKKYLLIAHPSCTLPGAVAPDPVTGYTDYPACWLARREGTLCGPNGVCWELKPTLWQRFMARFKA